MSFDIGQTILCNHIDRFGNTYTDPSQIDRCPKCHGKGDYYDLVWNATSGEVSKVEDLSLLQELAVKAVLTSKGDNIYHPSYGTAITDSVAAPSSSVDAVARLIEQQVVQALGGVRFRQDQQLEIGQVMTDDELIRAISGIEVEIIDERTLKVVLSIIAESGSTSTFTI